MDSTISIHPSTYYTVLLNRDTFPEDEAEETSSFIRGVVCDMGVPLDEIWPEGDNLTPSLKSRLRSILQKYSVEIVYTGDREYEIFVDNDLVAKWFKPRVVMRIDPEERELSKRFYYEVTFSYFSIFDLSDDIDRISDEEEYE